MDHHPGQFTLHLPNGYTQVNGGAVSANSVPAHTPLQQPQYQLQHQYQPMTPQNTPRHLPGSPWAGVMSNTNGQQQSPVQNQAAGTMSPFHATQPSVGQQLYGHTNNFQSPYTVAYGSIAQPYQHNIHSNIDFDPNTGYQSPQNNASQSHAQAQSTSDQLHNFQSRNISTKAQDHLIAIQRRQMEQQRSLLQQQTAQQRQATSQQTAQLLASQQQLGHQQGKLQQTAQQCAAMSASNNTTGGQIHNRVSLSNSQTTQGRRTSPNSYQASTAANRPLPTTLPPSPQRNGVGQHTVSQRNSAYTHVPGTPTVGNVTPAQKRSPPKSGPKTRSDVKLLQTPVVNHQTMRSFNGNASPQPKHARSMNPLEQRSPKSNGRGNLPAMGSPSPSLNNMNHHNASPSTTTNGQKKNSVMSSSTSLSNGRQQHNAPPIPSVKVQRHSSLMAPTSSPMSGVQQYTGAANFDPTVNTSHTPTLNRQVGLSPSKMHGKKRQADHTSNDKGSPKKKRAIEGHDIQQDPSRYKSQTALDQLNSLKVQAPNQSQRSQKQAEQYAKWSKQQEELDTKRHKEQEEHDTKLRKEKEEQSAKMRQEQEELQREYQRQYDLRLERERLLARKEALKKDESALYRHYREFMLHFPDTEREGRNPYLWRLLANQIMPIDTTTETGVAIAFAKEHWDWYMEYPKDVQRAYKEATKAKEAKGN